jgi:hypothetical protein
MNKLQLVILTGACCVLAYMGLHGDGYIHKAMCFACGLISSFILHELVDEFNTQQEVSERRDPINII